MQSGPEIDNECPLMHVKQISAGENDISTLYSGGIPILFLC